MPNEATFQFFAGLNEFLLPDRRGGAFSYPFKGQPSVKHLIEALGVPHTEVGRILVNGQPEDFNYGVKDGDQVAVYPYASLNQAEKDFSAPVRLEEEPRFVLDNHLGRLTAYLRMLGFDATYRNDFQDDDLVRVAVAQKRILLTRDRRLLMRRAIKHGYLVRSHEPDSQLVEILNRFDLYHRSKPFRRCLRCNTPLKPVSKDEVLDRLEPLTRRYYHEFHQCPGCNQVYWKGSHYERMLAFIESLIQRTEDDSC